MKCSCLYPIIVCSAKDLAEIVPLVLRHTLQHHVIRLFSPSGCSHANFRCEHWTAKRARIPRSLSRFERQHRSSDSCSEAFFCQLHTEAVAHKFAALRKISDDSSRRGSCSSRPPSSREVFVRELLPSRRLRTPSAPVLADLVWSDSARSRTERGRLLDAARGRRPHARAVVDGGSASKPRTNNAGAYRTPRFGNRQPVGCWCCCCRRRRRQRGRGTASGRTPGDVGIATAPLVAHGRQVAQVSAFPRTTVFKSGMNDGNWPLLRHRRRLLTCASVTSRSLPGSPYETDWSPTGC
jgi:hypothetical protein